MNLRNEIEILKNDLQNEYEFNLRNGIGKLISEMKLNL